MRGDVCDFCAAVFEVKAERRLWPWRDITLGAELSAGAGPGRVSPLMRCKDRPPEKVGPLQSLVPRPCCFQSSLFQQLASRWKDLLAQKSRGREGGNVGTKSEKKRKKPRRTH